MRPARTPAPTALDARCARPLVGAAAAALAALLLVLGTALAPAARADGGGSFVAWTNAARASAGLGAYSGAGDLDSVAAAWAAHLAATGVLAHNPNLRTQVHGWRYVGENVGVGPVASDINTAFMNSAPHRANILDHDFTQIGVATATGGGRLWVVEVFRQPTGTTGTTSSAAAPAPAAAPASTPASTPASSASSTPAARATPAPTATTRTATPSAPATSTRPRGSAVLGRRTTPSPALTAATPSAEQLLRQRAGAAAAGAGTQAATTPLAQALRFADVMAAAHG